MKNAELQAQIRAARTTKEATSFAMPTTAGTITAVGDPSVGWSLRRANPEEARARNVQNVDTTYAALYRQLDWTPEQRAQFRNVMIEGKESAERLFQSAVAAARAQNPSIDRAGMFEVFEATSAQMYVEQQAEVRRVLGPTAGDALERYQATLSVRSIANQLATALFNSESPITPQQADQIVDVLAQHARGPIGRVEILALNPDAAVAQAQAQGLLNDAQATELRRVAARVQEQSKTERERNTAPASSLKTTGNSSSVPEASNRPRRSASRLRPRSEPPLNQ